MVLQVHTYDVRKQCDGPHWTLRQWCLYWASRRALQHRVSNLHAATSSERPAEPKGSREEDDYEDEADSAYVQNGYAPQRSSVPAAWARRRWW